MKYRNHAMIVAAILLTPAVAFAAGGEGGSNGRSTGPIRGLLPG